MDKVQTLIDSFLNAMRDHEVGVVLVIAQALKRSDGTPFRRDSTHTNLPDPAARVLIGNLISTDGGAVEAVSRTMLDLLNQSGGGNMKLEELPAELKTQLTTGAQKILKAAAAATRTKKDDKPAIIT